MKTSWATESETPDSSGRLSKREHFPPFAAILAVPWGRVMAVLEVVLSSLSPTCCLQQLCVLQAGQSG